MTRQPTDHHSDRVRISEDIEIVRVDDNRRVKLRCRTCGAETYVSGSDPDRPPTIADLVYATARHPH